MPSLLSLRRWALPSLAVLALFGASSCSSDEGQTAVAASCTAGQVKACPCAGTTEQGVQTCLSDGNSFGACQGCPGGGAGASGAGAGGAGGGGTSGQGGGGSSGAGGGGTSGQGGGGTSGQGGGGAGGAGGDQSAETCEQAAQFPSNEGCEFWAVDLDQQDGAGFDPASAPWGVVITATSKSTTSVTVEINEAAPGQALALKTIEQVTLAPGETKALTMPTRELDCGVKPNDYASPGTCLSSRAIRLTATAPVVAQQFNAATNSYSNDASLLLPTSALGRRYRVVGWGAGHPIPVELGPIKIGIDRSYVTVIGTQPGTKVRVTPSSRIHANPGLTPPIPTLQANVQVEFTLGPFDVLNLETDDFSEEEAETLPLLADLTGTSVEADKPVVVFSGSESTGVPGKLDIPKPPGWMGDSCCLDHLEEQMFPVETLGKSFVITRSPLRSTGSNFAEADVLRFVGASEPATVKTSLPPPFDSFTLQPGEIKDTWTQTDIVVDSSAPLLIGQLLVSGGFVGGQPLGDPSLVVFSPVAQHRTRHLAPIPVSWTQNYVVIAARSSTQVKIDGAEPTGCVVAAAGELSGVAYEARRCPLPPGPHELTGNEPFGITVYGYGEAGSYAYAGGAALKPINP